MSTERTQLLLVKGMISEMPPEQQQAVIAVYNRLKEIIAQDQEAGYMAVALIGLEITNES